MSDNSEPMIKLEPGGEAPILSYNIPEPTSYSGRHYIELEIPANYFKANARKKPPLLTANDILANPKILSNVNLETAEAIKMRLAAGEQVGVYRTLYGGLEVSFTPQPQSARPRLLLVETCRLSSYLGNYGAGRTVKTFSLLPGEKTRISVKTYTRSESDAKSASSIFDSFTEDSADEFMTSLGTEQSQKQDYAETFNYHAEAEAECSWGFGSAKVSGGVKGGTNSAREEFAKNISNASEKHAAKASAKRDIQINTSYEVKEQTGEETSIEREIQNINVSRTLNFVFRQMNQEFITLLHLVDVRVAFFNGFSSSYQEVSLPDLRSLLEEVIDGQARQDEVAQAIIDELANIYDYNDDHHSFAEDREIKDKNGNVICTYLRIKKDLTSEYYPDPAKKGLKIVVPGIILSASKHVIRTEGIIVEALLGQGDGLDEYSHGLQNETVRAKALANELLQTQIKREKLGQKIVETKDDVASKIFQQVFPPPLAKDEAKEGEM